MEELLSLLSHGGIYYGKDAAYVGGDLGLVLGSPLTLTILSLSVSLKSVCLLAAAEGQRDGGPPYQVIER